MDFYLISLIFHIFAAMFWVGGILLYAVIIISVIRDPEFKDVKLRLLEKTALRFRKVSYFIFGVLLFSGTLLVISKGYLQISANLENMTFAIPSMFQLKIFLFVFLVCSSLYHDFFSGPSAFAYVETNPELFEKFRKRSALFGKVNLLISILIAILGILGSRGLVLF